MKCNTFSSKIVNYPYVSSVESTTSSDTTSTGYCSDGEYRGAASALGKKMNVSGESVDGKVQLNATGNERLVAILNMGIIVNSDVDKCPTFALRTCHFLNVLNKHLRLSEPKIQVERSCLYGGAASFCLAPGDYQFNDVDIVMYVNIGDNVHAHLNGIKDIVLKSLREVLVHCLTFNRDTDDINKVSEMDDETLTEAYIQKMYKHVVPGDPNVWSLFSFRNYDGRSLELKFVQKLERAYTFSIDSWQINIDNTFLSQIGKFINRDILSRELSTTATCQFPNIRAAVMDMEKRILRVVDPEAVRGGCILRYLDFKFKGFRPAASGELRLNVELRMLTRFCQDFPSHSEQIKAVCMYMKAHMVNMGLQSQCNFLRLLVKTIDSCYHRATDEKEMECFQKFRRAVDEKIGALGIHPTPVENYHIVTESPKPDISPACSKPKDRMTPSPKPRNMIPPPPPPHFNNPYQNTPPKNEQQIYITTSGHPNFEHNTIITSGHPNFEHNNPAACHPNFEHNPMASRINNFQANVVVPPTPNNYSQVSAQFQQPFHPPHVHAPHLRQGHMDRGETGCSSSMNPYHSDRRALPHPTNFAPQNIQQPYQFVCAVTPQTPGQNHPTMIHNKRAPPPVQFQSNYAMVPGFVAL